MAVPYTFATATSAIPLSQLDSNFATTITLGNTAIQLGNTVTTLNNMTLANVTISSGGSFTSNSISTSGNLTFTGTGNRILGDFSNATVANRVWIQSSTTNGDTNLYIVPNGTSTQSGVAVFNASTLTNAAYFNASITSSAATLDSGKFGTGTYLPMVFNTGGSERMRVDTSGNVGIGISAPSVRLDIVGSQYWRGAAAVGAVGIMTPDPTSGANGVNLAASFSTGGYGPLTFSTSATERMRIDTSGNVGIGVTSTGGYKFAVGGSGLKNQFITTDANNAYLYTDGSAYFGSTGAFNNVFITNNTERMRIDSAGNVGIGTVPVSNIRFSTLSGAGVTSLYTLGPAGSLIVDYLGGGLNYLNGSTTQFRNFSGTIVTLDITQGTGVLVKEAVGLGYGTGSGGTVTQGAGSGKATAVTLNKPTGQITMNGAALAAGATVNFTFNNSLLASTDVLLLNLKSWGANYRLNVEMGSGSAIIFLTNLTAGSLSDALVLNFAIIKGATS